MSNITGGGMRLAAEQPQGFRVVHTADPKFHRLGLIKMRIGAVHAVPGAQHVKGKPAPSQLIVREWSQITEAHRAKLKIVCLHRDCRGATFASEEEMRSKHPSKQSMLDAGEHHVWGWYGDDALDRGDEVIAHTQRLLERAKRFADAARKESESAKDFEALKASLDKLKTSEEQIAQMQRILESKQPAIVGYVSDLHMGETE